MNHLVEKRFINEEEQKSDDDCAVVCIAGADRMQYHDHKTEK